MSELIQTDAAFSRDECAVLRFIAAAMIPASAEFDVPGADDPDIFPAILERLARSSSEVRSGIAPLLAAPAEGRPQLLADMRRSSAPVLGRIASAVAQCYYQDPRVMASLGMALRPPYPGGFEIEQGDLSLLEPVRRRPKLYRRV